MKAIEWWLLFFILVHFFIYLVHAFKEFADRQTSTRPQSMEKVDRRRHAIHAVVRTVIVLGEVVLPGIIIAFIFTYFGCVLGRSFF